MGESMDRIWEEIHEKYTWGGYPNEHVIRFVARNYYGGERSGTRILDLGCGQGAHTYYLAREGFDAYAFDGSQSAVDKTIQNLSHEGLSARVRQMDALGMDYPDNFFDAIIDNVCIYSNKIENIHQIYRETHRILKTGGRLLTICFGEDIDGYRSGEEIEEGTYVHIKRGVLADRGLSHIFTREELTSLLYQTGFARVDCEWSKYTDRGQLVHHYVAMAQK